MFSLAKKTPLTMELFYLYFHQTCKKREIQHKRIFPPQKLAQKTRKSANIEIRDKTA